MPFALWLEKVLIMFLEKMLQSQGFGSRKHCQQLIKNGAVTIHGEVISDPKFKLDLNNLNSFF